MNIRIRFGAQTCQQWLMATLCVLVSLACVTPVAASVTDTTYTLSSMPIVAFIRLGYVTRPQRYAISIKKANKTLNYVDAMSNKPIYKTLTSFQTVPAKHQDKQSAF